MDIIESLSKLHDEKIEKSNTRDVCAYVDTSIINMTDK